MQRRSTLLVIVFALLTGCAATVKRQVSDAALVLPPAAATKLVLNVGGSATTVGASDWEGFKLEWKESFEEQAKEAGIAFELQEGPPRSTGEDGTLLFVYINDYRFLRPGTRYALGILSGNAYIDSKLSFSNLKSGEAYGSQAISTSSSAWGGVFSAMTNKQVAAIAADVLRELQTGKAGKAGK